MSRAMRWPLALIYTALVLPGGQTQQSINEKLQHIVGVLAVEYNISISIAAKLDSGEEFAAASGQGVTVSSLIPAGSATKPFTAVGLLRFADAGILDLDAPIVDIIDPWLLKQSLPALQEIFSDAANISKVTTKQLIGMRSGIADYNNSAMFEWTLKNPDKDYLPIDYMRDVCKKPFLFKPDDYTAYSSNGYVLAGMVLAALQKVPTWDALNQLHAIGLQDELQHTIFMERGRCSKYKGVTHQYALLGAPEVLWELAPVMPKGRIDGTCAVESGRMMHVRLVGVVLGSFSASSYEVCCERASKSSGMAFVFEGNNCTVLKFPQTGYPSLGAISGWTVQNFSSSDIVDLYNFSCLNGWTMGNIAFTPSDAVKFWHALLVKKSLVKPESINLMMRWSDMTHGWGNGMAYGYGLMKTPAAHGIRTKSRCSKPLCICGFVGCRLNATLIGHMGADWGSAMPLNGRIPALRASIAVLMTSAFRGMNTSLTLHQNSDVNGVLQCHLFQVLYQHQYPGFPDLVCPSLQGSSNVGSTLLV